ncbi:HAMP domain-containing protein [Duganella sp. FT92W]|uniref:histidine kinase n=1 Tax=Pseudoduganella rivuli TaxID=2666085 RepID=A0A7X2ISI1_9BURK|nr:ATP-binding protein [Pseudoduganella rivuli]MRV75291.1 HAMP domain-containing protein [Pseudoduganella rivuli]
MRLATRFKLMGLLSAAIVAMAVAILLISAQRVRQELQRNEMAGEMVSAITGLRFLTMEYVLKHEERTRTQWRMRCTSLAQLLADVAAMDHRSDAAVVAGLQITLSSIDNQFGVLSAPRSYTRNGAEQAVAAEFEARLSGQITNRMQGMIADAMRLSAASREGVLVAQRQEQAAMLGFGGLVMLVVAATAWLGYRSVVQSLQRLREGTQRVGAGDLAYRVDIMERDEIGDLARAFDGMTARLMETSVSRNELAASNAALQSEIRERQQAEARNLEQLARLRLLHQITRSIGDRQDLRSIFQVVLRCLEDQLPIAFGCACLYDRDSGHLMVNCIGMHSAAAGHPLHERTMIELDGAALTRCVQGEFVYETDIAEADTPFARSLAACGLRSLVLAPLPVDGRVAGILAAARRAPDGFSSGECDFLQQLSEHVALAVHQGELYAALQRAYDDMRQAQQKFLQQERLRALGQMASGIAHDINNAISPVALYTEYLLEGEAGLSPHARHCLEVVRRAVDDVAATVARMREFYRMRDAHLAQAPVAAGEVLQQVADLTRASWNDMPQQRGATIRLTVEAMPDLPPFMGVESDIREALTNLVLNAVDAMPDGGHLTLRARQLELGEQEGQGVRRISIEVSDTGIGMDEATQRRCLEPFFTTKGERGTGLGLAMVYGMAERHGGYIDIVTAPGKGTTVRLGFDAPSAAPAPVASKAGTRAGQLRILAVDDDPQLLDSLRVILERDGHRVTEADGGQAGIDLFRDAHASGEPYGLVVTDLGMPYVDGRKVAQAVKALSPATPVLLLTGWGQRMAAENDAPPYVDKVLGKPPRLEELRMALAECCGEEA